MVTWVPVVSLRVLKRQLPTMRTPPLVDRVLRVGKAVERSERVLSRFHGVGVQRTVVKRKVLGWCEKKDP